MKELIHRLLLIALLLVSAKVGAYDTQGALEMCGQGGVWLQILGSGGPELNDQRASSSYIVWLDGHARVLVDMGSGSSFNFERSGANFEDLRMILFTHFHVDHSADFPAFIKASYFLNRQDDLPVYGPSSNKLMPDTRQFVEAMFGAKPGAFKYLADFIDDSRRDGYRIIPHVVDTTGREKQQGYMDSTIHTTAIPVHHGPIPALGWRVEIGDKVIVFSGDMNGDYQALPEIAAGADLFIAHNAIPEDETGVARNLHMPPSVIGDIAARSKAKKLILSHRMLRTLGKEEETLRHIRDKYNGPVQFADDMNCFRP